MNITFETSELLKEKQFPLSNNIYTKEKVCTTIGKHYRKIIRPKQKELAQRFCFPCPTQSDLQKWLREKHNIHIEICYNDQIGYRVWIKSFSDNILSVKKEDNIFFNTYEEALEQGLLEGLKLIKE